MASILVKPRAGNRSAQLVMSVFNKRVNRKLPVSVGSVRQGANLLTGEGFTFKRGYSLQSLTEEDRAKIERWLSTAGKPDSTRPTLGTVSAKLDRMLELLTRAPAQGACAAPPPTPPASAAAPAAGDPFVGFERAFDEMLAALAARVEELKQSGVRLTRKSHTLSTPLAPGNALDELQAWTNRFRKELVPRFRDTCQALGLWKLGVTNEPD